MRIERVVLDGFGAFNRGLEVDLSERFTMIVGRNETGKSTLLNAIFGILFGFKDQNVQGRFEPWEDHERYGGELVLVTDEGRRIRIRRDFATQKASITETGVPAGSPELLLFEGSASPRGSREEDVAYFQKLGEILGFQDEAVFRNTVFVGQSSLQTSITDQIRRLISGSSSLDYRGALHELHARYAEITMRNPWRGPARSKPKLLERTEEQLLTDMVRLEDGKNLLVRSVEVDDEIERLEHDLCVVQEIEATASAGLARFTAFLQAKNALSDAERRFEEALKRRDSAAMIETKVAETEARIKRSYRKFVRVKDEFDDHLKTLITEERAQAEEAAILEQENEKLAALEPRPNTRLGVFLGIAGLGLGLGAGAVPPIPFGAGAVAGTVLGLILFFAGRAIGTGYREARAAITAVIERTGRTHDARSVRIAKIREAYGDVLEDEDLEALRTRYREYAALREERQRRLSALRALGEKGEIERSYNEAAGEQSHARTRFSEVEAEAPYLSPASDPAELSRAIEEERLRLSAAAEKRAGLERRLGEARIEQARLSGRMDFDLTSLEEGVHENEARLTDLETTREALRLAIDTLDECVREYQSGDVHRLESEISGIFARITGDRYMRVRLSGGMEPTLERGDRVNIDPEALSQGAKDQLYFAMRVAMARHLSRKARLPFFLDDPFVNFDDDRLKVTRDLLGHLDDHQVIMVTCNRAYEPWADRVLDLDRAHEAAIHGERAKLS